MAERQHFDICLILLQSAEHDARTLNIAESARRMGKSVCIIALGIPNEQQQRRLNGITAYYCSIPTVGRLWKRWLQFYRYAWSVGKEITARQVWCEDVFCLPLCSHFARRWDADIIYDSREIFSALGALHSRPIRQYILTVIEQYFVRYVRTIVVSGKRDAEYLTKYFQRDVSTVLMNLPQAIPLIRTHRLRERWNIDPFYTILLYQGAISHGRGIAPMIRALPHIPNAVFCLLGDGEQKDDFMRLAEERNVHSRVFFGGKIPYHELPEWTASADIGIALIEPISFSYSLALPNKLFEYAMAGLPVLASNLPAMQDILQEIPFGVCIEQFNDDEILARTIQSFLSPATITYHRTQALLAREHYTWQAQEHILHDLFPS